MNLVYLDDLENLEKFFNVYFCGEFECYICDVCMKYKKGYWVKVFDKGKV